MKHAPVRGSFPNSESSVQESSTPAHRDFTSQGTVGLSGLVAGPLWGHSCMLERKYSNAGRNGKVRKEKKVEKCRVQWRRGKKGIATLSTRSILGGDVPDTWEW
jgi:hypothetical protein